MPAEPGAGMAGTFQRADKTFAAFFVGPVVRIAIKHEMAEAAGEKMFGYKLRSMRVVFQHASEFQVLAAEAEINGGLFGIHNKFRQIIASAEPGQDAVAFPTPGNDLLASKIGGEMPIVLLGKFLNAPVQTVVIPAKGD